MGLGDLIWQRVGDSGDLFAWEEDPRPPCGVILYRKSRSESGEVELSTCVLEDTKIDEIMATGGASLSELPWTRIEISDV